jgi:hypothetical protein
MSKANNQTKISLDSPNGGSIKTISNLFQPLKIIFGFAAAVISIGSFAGTLTYYIYVVNDLKEVTKNNIEKIGEIEKQQSELTYKFKDIVNTFEKHINNLQVEK